MGIIRFFPSFSEDELVNICCKLCSLGGGLVPQVKCRVKSLKAFNIPVPVPQIA